MQPVSEEGGGGSFLSLTEKTLNRSDPLEMTGGAQPVSQESGLKNRSEWKREEENQPEERLKQHKCSGKRNQVKYFVYLKSFKLIFPVVVL